jgi:hypothetical protein
MIACRAACGVPIPFQSPLPPGDNWAAHRAEVKRSRGTACYGALVTHFGTDSPKELELRVDHRSPYRTEGGDASISNKYRRWRQGKALPNDDSIRHVLKQTGGSLRLERWRDLMLWELLDPEPPSIQRINHLLEQSAPLVRKILFFDGAPNNLGRYVHSNPDRAMTLGIRNHFSLDAFLTLLCLARKGELLEEDPQHFLPATCAFDIFPRVLYAHPQLAYRWEGLYACLERIYWRRLYGDGIYYSREIGTVRANLHALQANPAAALTMLSGRRVRNLNSDPLGEIEKTDHHQ